MFTPISKNEFKDKLTNYLKEGFIIRYDFRNEKPLEVLPREFIPSLPKMGNIGIREGVVENVYCDHEILHQVAGELSKEYSVREVRCSYSGCCQYTTYGYYLD